MLLGEVEKLNRYSLQKSEELEKLRYKCLNMESNKVKIEFEVRFTI